MTWRDLVTAKGPGCPDKDTFTQSEFKAEIFGGVKPKPSLYACRVRARVHAGTGEPSGLEEH